MRGGRDGAGDIKRNRFQIENRACRRHQAAIEEAATSVRRRFLGSAQSRQICLTAVQRTTLDV
jgi:hypothetical protein